MTIGLWWQESVTVETYLGSNALGETFAAPVTVPCFIDDSTVLTRNAKGEEIVSQTVVYADPSYADSFAPDSRVTVNGRTARVITCNAYTVTMGGLPAHVEARLT